MDRRFIADKKKDKKTKATAKHAQLQKKRWLSMVVSYMSNAAGIAGNMKMGRKGHQVERAYNVSGSELCAEFEVSTHGVRCRTATKTP
jgi:hypothetical protein